MPEIEEIDFDNLTSFEEDDQTEKFEKTKTEKENEEESPQKDSDKDEESVNESEEESNDDNDEEDETDDSEREEESSEDGGETDEEETSEEQSEESSDSEDERPVPEVILENLGIEKPEGEEFEDSVEGIEKAFQYAVEQSKQEQLETVFDQFPDVKQYFEFRNNGGDPEEFLRVFNPDQSFENVEFAEDNPTQHEQIVRNLLEKKGYKHIDERIKNFRDSGVLKNEAQYALEELKEIEQQEKQELTQRQEEQRRQQQQEIEQFWTNVKETIDKNDTIADVPIPKAKKDKFFDFISKPVKDGRSQRDLKAQELPLEKRLLLDYLIFEDFDFSKFVDKKADTKNAQRLRDQLKSKKEKGQRAKQTQSKKKDSKGEKDIDFSRI